MLPGACQRGSATRKDQPSPIAMLPGRQPIASPIHRRSIDQPAIRLGNRRIKSAVTHVPTDVCGIKPNADRDPFNRYNPKSRPILVMLATMQNRRLRRWRILAIRCRYRHVVTFRSSRIWETETCNARYKEQHWPLPSLPRPGAPQHFFGLLRRPPIRRCN